MYENWKIERWETPISDAKNLGMVSLKDLASSNTLEILLNDSIKEIIITFNNYPAYRNILEEYRLELWRHLNETSQRCGSTFIVTKSSWAEELSNDEPFLEVHNPGLKHFVICTDDDVVEILSNKEPKIEIKV